MQILVFSAKKKEVHTKKRSPPPDLLVELLLKGILPWQSKNKRVQLLLQLLDQNVLRSSVSKPHQPAPQKSCLHRQLLANVVLQPGACTLTTTLSLSFLELNSFSLLIFEGGLQVAR